MSLPYMHRPAQYSMVPPNPYETAAAFQAYIAQMTEAAVASSGMSSINKDKSVTPPLSTNQIGSGGQIGRSASATPSSIDAQDDPDAPLNLSKPKQALLNHISGTNSNNTIAGFPAHLLNQITRNNSNDVHNVLNHQQQQHHHHQQQQHHNVCKFLGFENHKVLAHI